MESGALGDTVTSNFEDLGLFYRLVEVVVRCLHCLHANRSLRLEPAAFQQGYVHLRQRRSPLSEVVAQPHENFDFFFSTSTALSTPQITSHIGTIISHSPNQWASTRTK